MRAKRQPASRYPKTSDDAGPYAHAEPASEICDSCGREMALKRGRFGEFLACTGYPKCKFTRKIQTPAKPAASEAIHDEACPECGEHLLLKQGRYGSFAACSKYPKCKYVKQETTGVRCPECGTGDLVVKHSRRGTFYGCSNYPTCKFTLKDKPVPHSCPQCATRFLVEHARKDGGRELQCRAVGCKFKEELTEVTDGEPATKTKGSS